MKEIIFKSTEQIQRVSNLDEFILTPFQGEINAICWNRTLLGDFSEIANLVELKENMIELDEANLLEMELTECGKLAREILLNDLRILKEIGASPILNIIKHYERDDIYPFFPTDVYSFHVDRSPIPTSTFLCTYHGAASEIVPNSHAEQKIRNPEIRAELKKQYRGSEEGFESFLTENFFDLHYHTKPNAPIINLGIGNIWRLAVDHPESEVLPCIHRAPREENGERRLLLIC